MMAYRRRRTPGCPGWDAMSVRFSTGAGLFMNRGERTAAWGWAFVSIREQTMALDAKQLLGKSQAELDALFSAHESGPIPDGEGAGTAIIAPGTEFSDAIAACINIFAWKGKVFDAKDGFLRNEILPLGLKAIVARVYKAPSWLDGKECIVLDYSQTSLVAAHIRDEIRLVDQGFYLGKVYWDSKRLIDFSLDFRGAGATA